jgi:AcrR family transcriptional regulator
MVNSARYGVNTRDNEEAILLAAMEEFRQKGVYGARMQAIADRAGVNKALLHYYFRSKERLYLRVLEEILVPFSRSLEVTFDSLEPDDFAGAVRSIVSLIVDSTQALPYSTILLMELASGGPYLTKLAPVLAAESARTNKVISFFDSQIERGIIRPINPLTLFFNIFGMGWNIFLAAPMAAPLLEAMGVEQNEAYYREYIDSIVEMAVAGMVAKPRS